MIAQNKVVLPEWLKNITNDSSHDDLIFQEEIIAVHPDVCETKRGFRLKSISGNYIPDSLVVVYVIATKGDEKYYYVISWVNALNGEKREFNAKSEEEAKRIVLKEIKLCIA